MSIVTRSITAEIEAAIYVRYSIFEMISMSSDYGGVIKYGDTNNVIPGIIVEFCSFRACSSEKDGGCIYVSAKCPCIVYFVCSYNCIATNWGQFIYTDLKENTDKKNYVKHSSLCSPDQDGGDRSPICLCYGQRECSYVNISNYKVNYYQSAIYYGSGNSQTNNITYCTISNTQAVSSQCIELSSIGKNNKIQQCQIVSNTQNNKDEWGTIACFSTTYVTISQCYFEDNTATKLFYADGNSQISVEYCNIDQSYDYSSNVDINSNNNNNKALSLNFDSIPEDCSEIHLLRCNTKDCAKGAGNVLNLFGNLYVLSILIKNK